MPATRSASARKPVGIGVGIHTGIACVGNMGSEARFNYSAVGDAVNVAARIETCCKVVGFDVLVSESTAAALPVMPCSTPAHWSCAAARAGTALMRSSATRGGRLARLSRSWRNPSALVAMLRARCAGLRKVINLAKAKALPLTPALQEFYCRISRRADHFALPGVPAELPVQKPQANRRDLA